MTTALTPQPEALRLAAWLEQDWDGIGVPELQDVAAELRRLHAERDRYRAALDEWLKKTEWVQKSLQPRELGKHRADILRERITALEARKLPPLSDEQIDAIAERMPGGMDGFLKVWGWRQFAREILAMRRLPKWEPCFDAVVPQQEELAIQFCQEIAGPRGKRGSPPDPVRLLEMAEALYKAEADARRHGITGEPA